MLDTLKWMGKLHGALNFKAVLSYPADTPPRMVTPIHDAARAVFHVERFSYICPIGAGWPRGPNKAWQATARYMATDTIPWLWLEADAIPLKPDWLTTLDTTYAACGKPFMGAIVPRMGHCNGVAIYPSNAALRCPKAMGATSQAWDYVMREEMIHHCHDASGLIFHFWGVVKGRPHPYEGAPPHFETAADITRWIPPSAVLVHRCKDHSLTKLLGATCTPAMKCSILIVSWLQDRRWLKYCLRSIAKYSAGFHETVVLVPEQEASVFRDRVPLPNDARWATYPRTSDKEKWHLHHQAMKCHADLWCPDADFILHIDSDCVFSQPVRPVDYFVSGKPVMLMEPYLKLTQNPWQVPTQNALKRLVSYEFMRRHPQINPIAVYGALREHMLQLHSKPLEDYVLTQKAGYPWGFSEHNVIGAYAYGHYRDDYYWIDVSKEQRPPDKLIQFWSHSPPEKPQDMPNGGHGTPLEMLRQLGL